MADPTAPSPTPLQSLGDSLYSGWALLHEHLPKEVAYLLVMAAACGVVLLLIVAPFAGIATYVERRLAGRIQARQGPNRVGIMSALEHILPTLSRMLRPIITKIEGVVIPGGLLQFLADGLKLIKKEDLIPAAADRALFRMAPYVVFIGGFGLFAALPFGEQLCVTNLNIGIVYLLGISSLVVVGLLMAGWGSGNKWALFGAMRSAAQIVSYEIPVGISLLTMVMIAGTLNMSGIVNLQGTAHLRLYENAPAGGPGYGMFDWFVFRYPLFTLPAFLVYYIGSLAEVNRTPFDIPEAESELVAGYHTEYSGIRFSFFFMAEYAEMLAVSCIATTVFLGGWQPVTPSYLTALADAPAWLQRIEGVLWFFGKAVFLVLIQMQLRWTLPRYRVDQLMDLCWKRLLPVAMVNLIGVSVWMAMGAS
ncbi:MAG: NADH-quinone oxidoreductase subunit H [Planctomycetes bacterium]|nr:NADH-quinone oxidoreductase subunit H [Planctomycetota bacterium]